MPRQRLRGIKVEDAWKELLKFIRLNKDVPILLMGDTNKSWQRTFRRSARSQVQQVVQPSDLEKVLGFQTTNYVPVSYPHLALDDRDPATTKATTGGFIDNFIFFYRDGKKHDDFQKNYRVHYHRLGWTSHHVLVFVFNESLLEYK